ncbi:TPA: ATP-binding protein [Neisseria gonorrhoeae]
MALKGASDFLRAFCSVQTERRQCAEHGGYAAKSVLRGVWTGCPACRKLEAADEMAAYAETLRRRAMRDALEKRIGRSGIAPRFRNCRIENYAVSDSIPGMARAKAAAAEYAANFADVLQTGRSMIFSGRRGTGKNHLACGIAREVIAAGKSALVITVGDMLRTVKDSFGGGGGEAGAVGIFVKPDLLVLDEFGAGSLSETDGRILFSVVNARYERLMPMLVLTNLTAEAFRENTDARIRDRLRDGGGKLIPFDWESYRA